MEVIQGKKELGWTWMYHSHDRTNKQLIASYHNTYKKNQLASLLTEVWNILYVIPWTGASVEMLLRTVSTIMGISALVSRVSSGSSVSCSLSELQRELAEWWCFSRGGQALVFLHFVAFLVVEDVFSRERLVAPLSTLLIGFRLRLLAVLSTLLVDWVATSIVRLMLMFLFLSVSSFVACSSLTPQQKTHCCSHELNSPRLFSTESTCYGWKQIS